MQRGGWLDPGRALAAQIRVLRDRELAPAAALIGGLSSAGPLAILVGRGCPLCFIRDPATQPWG
jgi:hypothetical protein